MSVRALLTKADEGLQRLELLVICVCLAVILLAVCTNVLSRSLNLRWLETSDLALVCMTVLTFIGSAYAVARRAHITIDLGEMFAGAAWIRRAMAWSADAVIALTSLLFVVYGGDLLAYVIQVDERSSGMELPLWIPVGSLWLGAAFSLFHLGVSWVQRWKPSAAAPDGATASPTPNA